MWRETKPLGLQQLPIYIMHVRNGPVTELLVHSEMFFIRLQSSLRGLLDMLYSGPRTLRIRHASWISFLFTICFFEWVHWNSVRDGEVGAEEDNGSPRLSYQPMRKKSNGSVSTHKTYGIILRERIGSPSVHPRSSVHPPPPSYTTNPHYHSPQSFLPLIMWFVYSQDLWKWLDNI